MTEWSKRFDRATTILLALLVLFLISGITQAASVFCDYNNLLYSSVLRSFVGILEISYLINPSAHFFLYYSVSRQHRAAFREILRKIFCCTAAMRKAISMGREDWISNERERNVGGKNEIDEDEFELFPM